MQVYNKSVYDLELGQCIVARLTPVVVSDVNNLVLTGAYGNVNITAEALQHLIDGLDVHVSVVDGYLLLLAERDERKGVTSTCCYCPSAVTCRMVMHLPISIDLDLPGFDLSKCKQLFLPLLLPTHWALLVVDFPAGSLTCFNSDARTPVPDNQIEGILASLIQITHQQFSVNTISPEQPASPFDSGVLMLLTADFLSDDLPLCFNVASAWAFRSQIARQLLQGSIAY